MNDRSLHSVSSLSSSSRRTNGGGDFDRDACGVGVGQSLTTTCNDPRTDAAGRGWLWARADTSWQLPPPPIDPTRYPAIQRADLQSYLAIVSGHLEAFHRDRDSLAEGLHQHQLLTEGLGEKVLSPPLCRMESCWKGGDPRLLSAVAASEKQRA